MQHYPPDSPCCWRMLKPSHLNNQLKTDEFVGESTKRRAVRLQRPGSVKAQAELWGC